MQAMEQKRSHADLVPPDVVRTLWGAFAFGEQPRSAARPWCRISGGWPWSVGPGSARSSSSWAWPWPSSCRAQPPCRWPRMWGCGPGAAWARFWRYIGFALPAFLLMLALSVFYFQSRDVAWVASTFSGLKVVVTALVTHAALSFSGRYLVRARHMLLALAAGFWLGLGGNPIPALVFCCVSAPDSIPERALHGRSLRRRHRQRGLGAGPGRGCFPGAGPGGIVLAEPEPL